MSLAADEPKLSPTADAIGRLVDFVRASVVVRDEILRLAVVAMLARGHVLLEDVPGVGKTLMARTLAAAIGGQFHRVQFTADLLPADITGGSVYDQSTGDFHFRPGPIFANVVLADEINRGTPRAQASLLEAMGEGHVSVDGETHPLPAPFMVLATQNPIDQHGTFPLPESELDRFAMLLRLGRPNEAQAREILRRHQHAQPSPEGSAVLDLQTILAMQQEVLGVHVSDALQAYVAAITLATREHPRVGLPASPRASVALLRCAQSMAVYHGRRHALPDDVKAVATSVLGHRLAVAGADPETVVLEVLDLVPVPVGV